MHIEFQSLTEWLAAKCLPTNENRKLHAYLRKSHSQFIRKLTNLLKKESGNFISCVPNMRSVENGFHYFILEKKMKKIKQNNCMFKIDDNNANPGLSTFVSVSAVVDEWF